MRRPAVVPLEELASALSFERNEMVSIVGGGGKTTTMFALGRQLAGSTIITTTTKLGRDQTDGHPVLVDPSDEQLRDHLAQHGSVVALAATDGQRALGVSVEVADRWFGLADNVVIEADGARHRSFKAPRPREPVIPSKTTVVVAIIGADALGGIITDVCFRPLRVAALLQCSPSDRLTPRRAAQVIMSERGSQKGVPVGARFALVVTKISNTNAHQILELQRYLAGSVRSVVVGPDLR